MSVRVYERRAIVVSLRLRSTRMAATLQEKAPVMAKWIARNVARRIQRTGQGMVYDQSAQMSIGDQDVFTTPRGGKVFVRTMRLQITCFEGVLPEDVQSLGAQLRGPLGERVRVFHLDRNGHGPKQDEPARDPKSDACIRGGHGDCPACGCVCHVGGDA